MLRSLPLVLAFALLPISVLANTMAPADEYFGPFHQSVLEIRNRLASFEQESNDELSENIRGLDNVETAIEDWYRQYPADPWLPGFVARTQHLYAAAGYSDSRRAQHMNSILNSLRR